MTTKMKQRQRIKEEFVMPEELIIAPANEASKNDEDSLAELLGRAKVAYVAYLEAQKEVAAAYREKRSYECIKPQGSSASCCAAFRA